MTLKKIAALLAIAGITSPALATNGMNMEGYGPIATGMGGASMAYDNGTAAVANNPATLGLMPAGTMRLDVALGMLGPDVNSSFAGFSAPSSGDAYYMPALGFAAKTGKLAYGVGVFAQGGMGTEYGTSSFLSAGTGRESRSELGVGRLIFPLAYNATDALTIGGSIDYVWAGLDLRMAMPTQAIGDMFVGGGGSNTLGTITATPTLAGNLMAAMGGGATAGYFDFSNSNDFTGAAMGYGWAGKLGFTYKISPQLTIGGTYHSKTRLGDLETDNNATITLFNGSTVLGAPLQGKIKVKNFQWPETYGLGVAYQANDKLLVAADYKRINWSKVMQNFTMEFTSGSESLTAALYQKWDDQDVFAVGLTYGVTDALRLRAGFNYGKNPIPDAYLNALFPAIVETHYTVGAGYAFSKASDLNFSLTYAPEVSQTNSSPAAVGGGVKSSMSQLSWQLMYSHRF